MRVRDPWYIYRAIENANKKDPACQARFAGEHQDDARFIRPYLMLMLMVVLLMLLMMMMMMLLLRMMVAMMVIMSLLRTWQEPVRSATGATGS